MCSAPLLVDNISSELNREIKSTSNHCTVDEAEDTLFDNRGGEARDVLSHILNMAIEWEWIDKRPAKIKRYREGGGRIIYLTIEQISRLIAAAKIDDNPQVYLFIMIGLETAMRRMEILSIRLEHIDLDRHVIYISQAKAGAREQPITKQLAEVLREAIKVAEPKQEWLFPSLLSKPGHTVNIEKPFRRVVERAELDPNQIVRHTLRHTAITHLVQAGVDLPTVKRISGHKTLQMVERYSHQNGEHIQSAMDKLEERYNQASSSILKHTASHHQKLIKALGDPEEAAAYLKVALEEYEKDGDTEVFLLALRNVAEARGGMSELSKKTQLNRQSLYRTLSGKGNPTLLTLDAVLHGLGFRLSIEPLGESRG